MYMTTAGASVAGASVALATVHLGCTTRMAGAVMASDGVAVITIRGDIATALGDGAVVMVDMQDIMAATVTEAMALGVRPMATTTVTTIGIMATTITCLLYTSPSPRDGLL